MLRFHETALRRGSTLLFEQASFAIHPGWRVGLTGRNGSGKSSLFALIRGELAPDHGEFGRPPGWTIAHVRQETPALATPAIEFVLDGDTEWRQLDQARMAAEDSHDMAAIAAIHERLDHIDGYATRARAATLLHGLGFGDNDFVRPVSEFSGGWRMRLNLGQALMSRSDLLLLDEPTNHLDLDAVVWLEGWLKSYTGTLLLISHDREFLDNVIGHVLHIADGRVELYSGNFSGFERRRSERLAQQQAQAEKQQRERAHLQSFIDRFKAKASKARQAQSRVKALERMVDIAAVRAESPFHFGFADPGEQPNPLLRLADVAAGYGTHRVLQDLNLSLKPGDRIALLGRNGAGKSTLIKTLAGAVGILEGERIAARTLRVGYFAQHQLEQLDLSASPLEHFKRLAPTASEQALRNFLGGFAFSGEMATSPVAPRSGGEKARLALALIVYRNPSLLLLDEPTNHLDLDMREALTEALQEFSGALVLVSHDRALIRASCDELVLVHDGVATPFAGDLDDYAKWLSRSGAATSSKAETSAAELPVGSRRDERRSRADARSRLKPLRDAVSKIEKRVEDLSGRKAKVEAQLADPDVYAGDAARVATLIREQADLGRELAAAEHQWLVAHEELEQASSN